MGINLFTVYIHCTTPTPSQHSPRDQPTIVEPFKDFKVKAAACYIEPMTTESSVYGRSHAQARSRHHLVSGTVLYRTVLPSPPTSTCTSIDSEYPRCSRVEGWWRWTLVRRVHLAGSTGPVRGTLGEPELESGAQSGLGPDLDSTEVQN
jgi:hypothetical protein